MRKAADAKDSCKLRRLRLGLGLKDRRDPSQREASTADVNEAKSLG